jgi:hypothetical protein
MSLFVNEEFYHQQPVARTVVGNFLLYMYLVLYNFYRLYCILE